MKQVKGFITKASFIKNIAGQVNQFFELSPLAYTYSKNRAEYRSTGDFDNTLHTFQSVNGSSNYVLSSGEVTQALEVINEIMSYATTYSPPYSLSDFQNSVQAGVGSAIKNVKLGPILSGTSYSLPEWVSFDAADNSKQTKLWLASEAFEEQYLEYTIVPVKPIDNLNSFFTSYPTAVSQFLSSDLFTRIEASRAGYPESYLRGYQFKYINPVNPNQFTNITWPALIYGRNGDNPDSIKDAISNYILANSTHTRTEWEAIFPDIFKRTEFLFLPRWDKVSIPNISELSSLYSSILDPKECITFAKEKWSTLSPSWVENHLEIIPFDYKALSLVTLTGQNNAIGASSLKALFSDYIPVGTMTLDFNRMEQVTKDWVLAMVELLNAAETASDSIGVNNPMRKVTRDGILYVSRIYQNVNYLVATRFSILGG